MIFKQFYLTALSVLAFSLFFQKNATGQTYFTVKFPDDLTLSQCNATAPLAPPTITGNSCPTDVGISHTDEIYTVVPDACTKIVRTWTVLYWCDFNPNWMPVNILNPNSTTTGPTVQGTAINHGYLKYVQIIKIVDGGDPVITGCTDLVFNDYSANDPAKYNHGAGHDLCEGPVQLSTKAWDACSGSNLTFRYLLFLDLNADGAFDSTLVSETPGAFPINITKNADTASANIAFPTGFELPYGKHMIKWIARDGCGHEAVCGQFFTIKDAKNPTVVCISGLSANLMNPSAMLEIWASDFLLYASDNCTPSDKLKIGIRKFGTGSGFPATTSVTLDCDDLGTTQLELWMQDEAGNADFCPTYIIVQANNAPDLCMGAPLQPFGKVLKSDGTGLSSVKMTLSGGPAGALPNGPMDEMTGADGGFLFPKMPSALPYSIAPGIAGNFTENITMADALRLRDHLWGTKPFTSPVEKLAADMDGSGSIDWADFQIIRDLATGGIDALPGATSAWRFFPKNTVFADPANPWATPLLSQLPIAGVGPVAADFTAFKMGDLVDSPADTLLPVNPTLTTQNIDNQSVVFLGIRPNPFRDRCELQFMLKKTGDVELSIFNVLGKRILLENREFADGENIWSLDAADFGAASEGVFFVKLKTENGEATERVLKSPK